MSKKWRVICISAFIAGCVAAILGFTKIGVGNFLGNFLAGISASTITFAIAVWLIEGSVMTRENRLQKVVSMACRDVLQINQEIAITLVREIGGDLASRLDSSVNLYEEERGDWKDFKGVLRKVFEDAREVPVKGLPKSEQFSKEDYLSYVDAARRFMERVGNAIGNSFEVQAELLELIKHRNRLNDRIIEAGYPDSIKDERKRYVRIAAIGDSMIDLMDGCEKIKIKI